MPIITDILIEDIETKLLSYDQIKIYRALSSSSDYEEITSVSTRVVLSVGTNYYTFVDTSGHIEYWYKYSTFNSGSSAESSLSSPFKGRVHGEAFSSSDRTYPVEYGLSYPEGDTIDLIRTYIGDAKKVKRDYVNPNNPTLYDNVSNDGVTYQFSEAPSWPLKILLDDVDYTSSENPKVRGYEFITFSGTTISTTSGVLDVWYENFRHSDREILDVFSTLEYPVPLTSTTITDEIMRVATAIALLESELRELTGSVDGKFAISGDALFDPAPVLKARQEDLNRLKKKLQDLVDDAGAFGLTGLSGIRIE